MPEVAVFVESREVAACEPGAAESFRLFPGPPPVAEHQARVAAVDREQPDFAGGQRLRRAGSGDDGDPPPALWFAGAARLDRHSGAIGDEGRAFAHAEGFVELLAGRRAPFRE